MDQSVNIFISKEKEVKTWIKFENIKQNITNSVLEYLGPVRKKID